MKNNIKKIDEIVNQLETTGSGYDLIRYVALPDLLGEDAPILLYVMGKNLARAQSFESIEQIVEFFKKVGWGSLELLKEKRSEDVFKLQTRIISERHRLGIETDYRLEAGFLAAAMEQIRSFQCECTEEEKPRKNFVELTVQHYR